MRKLSEIAHELDASMIDEGNRKGWAYYENHPMSAKLGSVRVSQGGSQQQNRSEAFDIASPNSQSKVDTDTN